MSDEEMQKFKPGDQVALSDDETAVSPMKINDGNLLGVNQKEYFKNNQLHSFWNTNTQQAHR